MNSHHYLDCCRHRIADQIIVHLHIFIDRYRMNL